MDIVDFQNTAGRLDVSLHLLIGRNEFKANLANEYISKYETLLKDGLASNFSEQIINQIAFYLYTGALAEGALIKIHSEVITNPALTINQLLNTLSNAQMEKDQAVQAYQNQLDGRSRGGRNKEKEKQVSMQKIEQAYKDKVASGYSFKLGHLSKFYTAMATEHDLDFGSIKNRVEKLRITLGHTRRRKKQSS